MRSCLIQRNEHFLFQFCVKVTLVAQIAAVYPNSHVTESPGQRSGAADEVAERLQGKYKETGDCSYCAVSADWRRAAL